MHVVCVSRNRICIVNGDIRSEFWLGTSKVAVGVALNRRAVVAMGASWHLSKEWDSIPFRAISTFAGNIFGLAWLS